MDYTNFVVKYVIIKGCFQSIFIRFYSKLNFRIKLPVVNLLNRSIECVIIYRQESNFGDQNYLENTTNDVSHGEFTNEYVLFMKNEIE